MRIKKEGLSIYKDRRYGIITIDEYQNFPMQELSTIFKRAIPLEVKISWNTESTKFLIWHPAFTPVPLGELIPYYDIQIIKTPKRPLQVEFIKKQSLECASYDWPF